MDLGVELGARTYVFWGGREGAEVDAGKDPIEAIKRFRDAIDFLCDYARDQRYDLRFALEAKPNEPRGDIYFPPPRRISASSPRWRTRTWWASTPSSRTSRWPA